MLCVQPNATRYGARRHGLPQTLGRTAEPGLGGVNGARPLFLEKNGMLPNVGEDHYWFKRVGTRVRCELRPLKSVGAAIAYAGPAMPASPYKVASPQVRPSQKKEGGPRLLEFSMAPQQSPSTQRELALLLEERSRGRRWRKYVAQSEPPVC